MDFRSTEFGNLEKMYGSLDYEGAAVLDIGAEYGTTAGFFLSKGARKVIASERNSLWAAHYRAWSKGDDRLESEEVFSHRNAERMLKEHKPDIVKVDCEGCEINLLVVPDSIMEGPRAWIMETHSPPLFDRFFALFESLGYTVQVVEEWKDSPNLKVISAVRHV